MGFYWRMFYDTKSLLSDTPFETVAVENARGNERENATERESAKERGRGIASEKEKEIGSGSGREIARENEREIVFAREIAE